MLLKLDLTRSFFDLKTSCLWRMKTQIPCCCFGDVYGPLTQISSASHLHRYFRQCAERISLEMVLLAVFALLRPTEGLTPPDGGMAMPIVFLPAPPTHHLQDWACQGVTGSCPYLLTRDHSCVFSFSWYIHTRLMVNQHKMAQTVWNTRQTDSGRTLSSCAIMALLL